jgi:hypothetical protein
MFSGFLLIMHFSPPPSSSALGPTQREIAKTGMKSSLVCTGPQVPSDREKWQCGGQHTERSVPMTTHDINLGPGNLNALEGTDGGVRQSLSARRRACWSLLGNTAATPWDTRLRRDSSGSWETTAPPPEMCTAATSLGSLLQSFIRADMRIGSMTGSSSGIRHG